MPRPFAIDSSTPIFAEYFYALALDEDKDIFNTNVTSHSLKPHSQYLPYDVVEKIINPLKIKGTLKTDAGKLLVPLEGLLILPDNPPAAGKYPLVIILHGNHTGFATIDYRTHKPSGSDPGRILINMVDPQRPSYKGYTEFQNTLAECGIASYSINLNIVNSLENSEHTPFEKLALDVNQRILLFFLHLKLLKLVANDPLTGDNFPIRFLDGTTFTKLKDVLQTSTHEGLMRLKAAAEGLLEFTKLGVMGHSRGADAVSRIHAYCLKGAAPAEVTFPKNKQVDGRIKDLSQQTRPQQDHIKSILALEPVAAKKEGASDTAGYVIDNRQTMFFVGMGTHDEDVTLDPVRIYEHPVCPKAMVVINGATHKRFNTIWAASKDPKDFTNEPVKIHLLDIPQHTDILKNVYSKCFTATLGNTPADFLPFTKQTKFPVTLPKANNIQCAWEFGFPFANATPEMKDLDTMVSGIGTDDLDDVSSAFEQEISAFVEKRENEGIFVVKIPINPASATEKLSNYTHFSFRFAKGFDLSKKPERIEQKNFTIEFFENDTLQGNTIEGKDITTIELKAMRAYDEKPSGDSNVFEYSILLQTVEIPLTDRPALDKINRIEIKIIPDTTKSPPRSGSVVITGSVVAGIVFGGIGVWGGHTYNEEQDVEDDHKKYYLIGGGLAGAAIGSYVTYRILKSAENAFAFKDFLLTNRQFP
jgi:hypothetical protein